VFAITLQFWKFKANAIRSLQLGNLESNNQLQLVIAINLAIGKCCKQPSWDGLSIIKWMIPRLLQLEWIYLVYFSNQDQYSTILALFLWQEMEIL